MAGLTKSHEKNQERFGAADAAKSTQTAEALTPASTAATGPAPQQ
jgi:hypothetical protein